MKAIVRRFVAVKIPSSVGTRGAIHDNLKMWRNVALTKAAKSKMLTV
jgi:hypothetical protein